MKYFLFLISLVFMNNLLAQEEESVYTKKELKAIVKEERKAKQRAEAEKMREQTKRILNMQEFVLEAEYVSNGKASRIAVNSSINFISVDSIRAVIQLGTTYGLGYNGLGGITVEGKIANYDLKLKEGKHGNSYSLMFSVMSTLGIFDISLLISDTGYTNATIRSNRSGQIQYTGTLIPLKSSRVFKGTSY